ncbi:hypothetical protein BCON_0031g00020 [Botryotinia convoluta]|uniref:Uncharacterized protein n=1 Tax=Botryotinia convoluta TaxID=54673 RepID=A0A4Z1IW15_9HELO|nr:hypothetical protein BCON_0031g00020 [Botryotinia convoluta]
MLEVDEGRKRNCWESTAVSSATSLSRHPTRLRWLEPGKVKARPKSLKALKASKASKASKDNGLEKTVTKAATSSVFNYAITLPVEIFIEPGALIQAVEYCKS